jgi:hypothetical protein
LCLLLVSTRRTIGDRLPIFCLRSNKVCVRNFDTTALFLPLVFHHPAAVEKLVLNCRIILPAHSQFNSFSASTSVFLHHDKVKIFRFIRPPCCSRPCGAAAFLSTNHSSHNYYFVPSPFPEGRKAKKLMYGASVLSRVVRCTKDFRS